MPRGAGGLLSALARAARLPLRRQRPALSHSRAAGSSLGRGRVLLRNCGPASPFGGGGRLWPAWLRALRRPSRGAGCLMGWDRCGPVRADTRRTASRRGLRRPGLSRRDRFRRRARGRVQGLGRSHLAARRRPGGWDTRRRHQPVPEVGRYLCPFGLRLLRWVGDRTRAGGRPGPALALRFTPTPRAGLTGERRGPHGARPMRSTWAGRARPILRYSPRTAASSSTTPMGAPAARAEAVSTALRICPPARSQ